MSSFYQSFSLIVCPHRFSLDFWKNIFPRQLLGETHAVFSPSEKADEMPIQPPRVGVEGWGDEQSDSVFREGCLLLSAYPEQVVGAFALCCGVLLLSACVTGCMLETVVSFLFLFEIFRSFIWIVCQILQRLGTIVVVMGSNCFYVQLCKLCLLPVTLSP